MHRPDFIIAFSNPLRKLYEIKKYMKQRFFVLNRSLPKASDSMIPGDVAAIFFVDKKQRTNRRLAMKYLHL